MSELKYFFSTDGEVCTMPAVNDFVYLKSEADAYIRKLKYKRCLAMARWCKDKMDTIKNGYIVSSIESQYGVMTTCPPECNPKFSFYYRWQKRWMELAEKFKETK